MTTLSWVPRLNVTKVVSVTPTISTSAYTTGDQIGGIMTLTDVVRQDKQLSVGTSTLASVTILDKGLQSAAIDVWFFNQSPTVTSVDNGNFSMSDANLVLQCIGFVSLGTAYSASALNSVSTNANLNIPVQVDSTATAPTNVYAIAVVRGTPTYVSTTDLVFQFCFYID